MSSLAISSNNAVLTPHSQISIEGFWAHGLNKEGGVRLDDDEGA